MWYKPYCSPLASSIFRSLSAPALCRKWTPQCHPNAALAGPSTEAHSWCWITGDTFPVPIISHNHGSLEVENGYYPILSLQYYPKLVSFHFWGKLLSKWVFSELFWTSEKQLFPQTPISQGQPECLEAGFIVLPCPQSFMIPASQILHESAILKKNNNEFQTMAMLISYIIILKQLLIHP